MVGIAFLLIQTLKQGVGSLKWETVPQEMSSES
jgi:hypothetical protein